VRRSSLFVLALLFVASTASAEEEAPPPPPKTHWRWYGWQTLAVDAAGLGLSFATGYESPYVVATLAGAPLVHFAHGHQVRALVDFGARVVLPLGIGIIASGPWDVAPADEPAKRQRFVTGAIIGALLASAFDAAVLGREEVPDTTALRISPTGVAGRF
jgi:hypothetical protein